MATGVKQKQLLTSSAIRSFQRCRKEFQYRYEIGLRPVEDSLALKYGTAMHRAIELLETEGLEPAIWFCRSTDWRDPFTRHTLIAQIKAYDWRWSGDTSFGEVLENEQTFEESLINPDTGYPSNTWDVAGKKDAKYRLADGRIALRETKTISEDPQSDRYWRRLLIDPQITHYYEQDQHTDLPAETIIYDVIRKPTIAPMLATPIDDRKYTTRASRRDGIDYPAGTLYANQRETDETPEEWEERLYADMLARPDFYLARREIPRLEKDVDEYRYERWDIAKDIRATQLNGHWYRNPSKSNCDNCCFFGLCTGLVAWEPAQAPPEGFQIVENIHQELV
jgi:hypothetical protein